MPYMMLSYSVIAQVFAGLGLTLLAGVLMSLKLGFGSGIQAEDVFENSVANPVATGEI